MDTLPPGSADDTDDADRAAQPKPNANSEASSVSSFGISYEAMEADSKSPTPSADAPLTVKSFLETKKDTDRHRSLLQFKTPEINDRFGNQGNLDDLVRKFHSRDLEVGIIEYATGTMPNYGLSASATDPHDPTWTVDSGCNHRAAFQKSWFREVRPYAGAIIVDCRKEAALLILSKCNTPFTFFVVKNYTIHVDLAAHTALFQLTAKTPPKTPSHLLVASDRLPANAIVAHPGMDPSVLLCYKRLGHPNFCVMHTMSRIRMMLELVFSQADPKSFLPIVHLCASLTSTIAIKSFVRQPRTASTMRLVYLKVADHDCIKRFSPQKAKMSNSALLEKRAEYCIECRNKDSSWSHIVI
ncbi:unnamed protein product [Phytophthora fragariaefolia]|uniref:Unnamed protein product n=1 Tax=Phytophthora fragariaefolia TaxID=1490495 RepID=A0A9W7CXP1_9STRA|nr:unnamed protein product [Phytophthora fragariaefolia]